jgi:hypothetical protein
LLLRVSYDAKNSVLGMALELGGIVVGLLRFWLGRLWVWFGLIWAGIKLLFPAQTQNIVLMVSYDAKNNMVGMALDLVGFGGI